MASLLTLTLTGPFPLMCANPMTDHQYESYLPAHLRAIFPSSFREYLQSVPVLTRADYP